MTIKRQFLASTSSAILVGLFLVSCSDTASHPTSERVGTTKEHQLTTLAASLTDLSSGVTPTELANTLSGSGVTVSNVTSLGASSAKGTFSFTGQDDVIGFSQGIILSSGRIQDIVGPNTFNNTTTSFGFPGNADLSNLAGVNTFDASVLQFNFVPTGDKVFFQYVFGSEEYNEYVGSNFNDTFGFFINGVNCAVVGSPPVPVTINTISNSKNSDLYVNNSPAAHYTEMDGFTKVLTCEAPANSGVENTMKLAIADGGDYDLDSWVLIKQGSLSTKPPEPSDTTPPETEIDSSPTAISNSTSPSFNFSGTDDVTPAAGLTFKCKLDEGDFGACISPKAYENLADGSHTFTVQAIDAAGNVDPTPASYTWVVDATAPKLSPTVSPNPVLLNGSATASPNADDGSGSGIASSSCDAVDTNSVGAKTVYCTATDNAGNTATATASYSVNYNFIGFAAPVDKPNTMNVSKAGQTIPLKWRLLDANNQPVSTLTSVTLPVSTLSCGATTGEDPLTEVASGSSGLQNLGDGYYQFNWKTPTTYANSCRQVGLNLGEGTPRTGLAWFNFK